MAEKVNINTASRDELNRSPNIGDECVDRIIEERESRGGFSSLDELDQIKGFGDDAIRNLRQNATT